MFLVVVDFFSKWLEVAVVSAATSKNTIDKLREMFARHGIPETMVTDNGKPSPFEFQTPPILQWVSQASCSDSEAGPAGSAHW